MHARGDLADLAALECELPELRFSVLRGEEEDRLAVRRPDRLVDIVFEAIGEEGLFPRLELLDEEALQVGFVAITLHADPADLRSVGREAWVRVVASVALGDIAGHARSEIIEVDVSIRGEGILKSRLLARGISKRLPVGTPGEFLRTTEGLGRSFIGFAFEDVLARSDRFAPHRSDEDMGDGLYPLVPMLVHQVGDDTTRGLRQVRIYLLRTLAEGDLLDISQLGLVGREEVVGEATFDTSHLLAVGAIGSHRPDLRFATLRRDIADATTLLDPACPVQTSDTLGELTATGAVACDGEEFGADLILLDVGEADTIDDRLAVGREGRSSDTC